MKTVTGRLSRNSSLGGWVWRRPAVELVGLAVGFALFSWVRDLAGTNIVAATANAHQLQRLEASVHLNVEVATNHWLAQHAALTQTAVLIYRLYYLPLFAVLVWLLFRRDAIYATVRRTLIVMASTALLVFWLYPMSPPRFALAGIVDVVAQHDLVTGGASRDLTNGQNHFSAMPSLHVGWAALCAYAAWLSLRSKHPRLAQVTWLFPVIMIGVVIATGNHYLVDVVGSAVLLAISIAVATGWDRWRRARVHTRNTPTS